MDIRIETDEAEIPPKDEETDEIEEDLELEGQPGEETIEVGEEPEVIEEETEAPPEKPPKKKSPKRKRNLAIIGIITLAIILILVAYIYRPPVPTEVSLMITESSNGEGIRVDAGLHSSSATPASGDGTLTINHGGKMVYSESISIKEGSEIFTIPYSNFVVENGDYIVTVEVEGLSESYTYNDVRFVVEEVTIGIPEVNMKIDESTEQAQFELNLGFQTSDNRDSKEAEFSIESIVHQDSGTEVTVPSDASALTNVPSQTRVFTTTVEYEDSGDYVFNIRIINNHVKSSSQYADFIFNNSDDPVPINAAPIAIISNSQGSGDISVTRGSTVIFYASESVDDGDNILDPDGYEWYFADTPLALEYGVEVEHTYSSLLTPGDYDVVLTVTDSGDGGEGKNSQDIITVHVS